MRGINLIPGPVRARARQRRAVRAWCVIAGLYAVVSLGVTGLLPRTSADETGTARELLALRGQASQLDASNLVETRRLAERRREAGAASAVGPLPDWSVLLRVLARASGERAVLESVELASVSASADKPGAARAAPAKPAPAHTTYALKIAGVTRSPDEAYVLARELEKTGLFARARVIETAPKTLVGAEVSGFRVQCDFADEPAPAARPGGVR